MNKQTVPVLELKKVTRKFKQGSQMLEITALVGPSGSGKSTLLQIAGLLDKPSGGEVLLDGQKCGKAGDALRTVLRRDFVGFVYQYHNLLPDFNALENVMLPMLIAGANAKAAAERAEFLLSSEMSGGEQQRVAIARALANQPKLLLADEPTGNLDPKTSETVFNALLGIVRETGLAALIATHNFELAERMDRRVSLEEGRLVELGSLRSEASGGGESFY